MIYKKKQKSYKDISSAIPRDLNEQNLIFFSKILEKYEHFVFFGTLLGLTRDNQLIDGDDDLDFYVNLKDRTNIINTLVENNIEVNLDLDVNKDIHFLQVSRNIDGKNLPVDLYFFEDNLEEDYIVEKWNIKGGTHIPSEHLRIPKIFIYPIKKIIFKDNKINIPSFPKYLCEFIYGRNWKEKLKKDKDYEIKVINGKPYFFKISKKFLFFQKKEID